MRRVYVIAIVTAVILAVVVFSGFGMVWLARDFFYPLAPCMPHVVEQPIEHILAELEEALKAKAPHVLAALQPKLSIEDIAELERQGNFQLPDDIRALYMWHNGSKPPQADWKAFLSESLIPGHRFLPLDEAVNQSLTFKKEMSKGPLLTRAFGRVFAAHRESWFTLFDDACGDGYFYDPTRKTTDGAIFYHFSEEGYYIFFPSIKNLLAGIVKCVKKDAFVWEQGPTGAELKENFELSRRIWLEFGASNMP